jgi:hypothetical protein
MADAEDLKSSGDFSSCGFDSHPGHQNNQCLCGDRGATPNRALVIWGRKGVTFTYLSAVCDSRGAMLVFGEVE